MNDTVFMIIIYNVKNNELIINLNREMIRMEWKIAVKTSLV
jgi:hypothetical protein